jgi:hypothetical protein
VDLCVVGSESIRAPLEGEESVPCRPERGCRHRRVDVGGGGYLGDTAPIAGAAFGDNDLITAMREQLYPRSSPPAIEPEVATERAATGFEDRSARIMVPRRWQPVSALRGIVNPLIDRHTNAKRN